MGEEDPHYTIVEYMSDNSGYKCGYCKSPDTNFSHGMWAHRMAVGDYKNLIDRGWRRSGKYCYKPILRMTCCPQYTIKCDALNFVPSKSQKKVLKRMHRYLSHGSTKSLENSRDETISTDDSNNPSDFLRECPVPMEHSDISISENVEKISEKYKLLRKQQEAAIAVDTKESTPKSESKSKVFQHSTPKDQLSGPDPLKPQCKKAKLLRRERQAEKRKSKESSENTPSRTPKNQPKTLDELLNEPLPENPAHRLELRLIHTSSLDFGQSFSASHKVFERYQMKIHDDSADECDESQLSNFLVDTPLSPWKPESGPSQGYGSFHQQYWLDDKLIAVGVIDILPTCASSVYLYYDPDYSFLSLGTYSSLRELALVAEINRKVADFRWYYMGFYIHSCHKMRYKGRYKPSFLLCPEKYIWEPIESCITKLDINKYSRFSNEEKEEENFDIINVLCFYQRQPIVYGMLQRLRGRKPKRDQEEIEEYVRLVGSENAKSILLYREN